MSRQVLVVGDVQGDYERLQEALEPYPAEDVDTVFLGDFFQGGRPGGAGGYHAARIAMERPKSHSILGNHDLMLLAVLEKERGGDVNWRSPGGRTLEEIWLMRRGDRTDLLAVGEDPVLEHWLRGLPLMQRLGDGTLVQHTDDDVYAAAGATVEEVNAVAHEALASPGGVPTILQLTIGRHGFTGRERLTRYLAHFGATRVVHGHTPHWEATPSTRHGGRVIGYDGRFSRFWGREPGEEHGPIGATVALLPPEIPAAQR
ncbi:MAG: metallophosphoesterase [Candidatus Dormibacteria bacterium]